MKDVNILKDLGYVALSFVLFFLFLYGVQWLDVYGGFAQAYHIMDAVAVAVKVATVSCLTWCVQKFVFPNTLGKDFGDTFNAGWNKLTQVEKSRWILITFLVLFAGIAIMM